jgi:DNA-directed RNA polymerase subunit A"
MEESIVNDPVGLKAIQSIMQTATQSNLSFFHKAGTMSNSIISLSPSVQQLLDLSKTPTCKTFVAGQIEPKDIVYVKVIHIIESLTITKPSDEEEAWVEVGSEMGLFKRNVGFPYQLDVQFDVKELIKRKLFLTDIVDALSSTVDIYNKMIIWSPNIVGIIRIYCDEHQTMIKALSKLHLGIEGIHDLMISHDGNTITNGSNLGKLLKLPGIDPNQTYSNHVLEMEEKFGIEAARQILYEEILIKNNNSKYAGIIADYMSVTGALKGFNKSQVRHHPILSMGYEESTSDLKRLGLGIPLIDHLENSYSRMALGLTPKIGTGVPQMKF